MTANVSYIPNPLRAENRYVQLEKAGAAAFHAGQTKDACTYTGFDRQCWMNGYTIAERSNSLKLELGRIIAVGRL